MLCILYGFLSRSVQTRKQVNDNLSEKSFLAVGHQIVKDEGFGALWAGLGPTYWGYLLEGAVKFGVYEVLKPSMISTLSRIATITGLGIFNSQIFAFVLSGTISGLAASLVLCPMEALRIRLVAEPNFAPRGWVQGGFKILQHEGVKGFTKGIKPMIMKQVPYTVTKNVSFDLFTKFFYSTLRQSGVAIAGTMTFTIPLVAAGIASILSSLSSQPGDMVLSLVNAHEGDLRSREVFRNIMRSERGFRGFFVGAKTRLLHVGIIVTIQLLIYDYVKRLCGIAATGSC
jgi:solute carrier family 25 phosphate transporter 3